MIARVGNERADATMATVRLDRQLLCGARAEEQIKIEVLHVPSILRALGKVAPDVKGDRVLEVVANACAWSSPHAAFYRVALKHTLNNEGVLWSELQAAWGRLGLALGIQEPPDDAWVE